MSAGKANGTSLLLIFAAIDLLCSAMVCGVLLTVVLIGGSGSSDTPSEGEGTDVGVTLVETWVPENVTLEVEGTKLSEPQQMAASDAVRSVLNNKSAVLRRSVYLLPPGLSVMQVRFERLNGGSASAAAIIHSGSGSSLAISISCQGSTMNLPIVLRPDLTLPTCEGVLPVARLVNEKAVVCIAPVPNVNADEMGKSVGRAEKTYCGVNQGYTSKSAFEVSPKFGIWALLL